MFGDLLADLASKAGLDTSAAEELRLKGNQYELVNAQLSALFSQRNVFTGDQDFLGAVRFTQGGITVDENGISAGNAVVIDQQGVFVKNDQSGALSFGDAANDRQYIDIKSGLSNELRIRNLVPGGNGGINFYDKMASGAVVVLQILEDADVADRSAIKLLTGPAGSKMFLGEFDQFSVTVSDFVGDTPTFMSIRGGKGSGGTPVNPTPPDPLNDGQISETHIYVRNNKLIFQYNDGGTVRYKYLLLTGTGVTWVHTTTPP